MSATTMGTIRALLESALDAVGDDEQRFQLRTALQLLDAAEAHGDHTRLALANANLGEELSAKLAELGYLD